MLRRIVVAGHSASKTRVNALISFRSVPSIGAAGTSPAATPLRVCRDEIPPADEAHSTGPSVMAPRLAVDTSRMYFAITPVL
jgi:hypothetical protein